MRNIEILKQINHPNVIKLYDAKISQDKKYIEIFTEFSDEGDLQMKLDEHKKKKEFFEENQLIDWLVQICCALKDSLA